MKRMIVSATNTRILASDKLSKNKGYLAAKRFKQKYPKAYEVLGK